MGMTSYLKAKPLNWAENAELPAWQRLAYLNANLHRYASNAEKEEDERE